MKLIRQVFVLFIALLFLVSTGGVSYLHHICWNHKAEHIYFVEKHACCSSSSSCCQTDVSCCSGEHSCSHSTKDGGLQTLSQKECCTDTHHFIKNAHPFRIYDNKTNQLLVCLAVDYAPLQVIVPSRIDSNPVGYLFHGRYGPDLLLHICILRT
jgi:hypothetical protein